MSNDSGSTKAPNTLEAIASAAIAAEISFPTIAAAHLETGAARGDMARIEAGVVSGFDPGSPEGDEGVVTSWGRVDHIHPLPKIARSDHHLHNDPQGDEIKRLLALFAHTPIQHTPLCVAWHPSRYLLAVGCVEGHVYVLEWLVEAECLELVGEYGGEEDVRAIRMDEGGRVVRGSEGEQKSHDGRYGASVVGARVVVVDLHRQRDVTAPRGCSKAGCLLHSDYCLTCPERPTNMAEALLEQLQAGVISRSDHASLMERLREQIGLPAMFGRVHGRLEIRVGGMDVLQQDIDITQGQRYTYQPRSAREMDQISVHGVEVYLEPREGAAETLRSAAETLRSAAETLEPFGPNGRPSPYRTEPASVDRSYESWETADELRPVMRSVPRSCRGCDSYRGALLGDRTCAPAPATTGSELAMIYGGCHTARRHRVAMSNARGTVVRMGPYGYTREAFDFVRTEWTWGDELDGTPVAVERRGALPTSHECIDPCGLPPSACPGCLTVHKEET